MVYESIAALYNGRRDSPNEVYYVLLCFCKCSEGLLLEEDEILLQETLACSNSGINY